MTCVGSFRDGTGDLKACQSYGPPNNGDCNDVLGSGEFINPSSNEYCDCNPATPATGGFTQGTTEVCGDTVDQDCNGGDLPCCQIMETNWNESFVWDWETVTLSVEGSPQCSGETVYLWLFEIDSGSSDRVTSIDLGTLTLNSGFSSKEWDVVWIRDIGDLTDDPEYYFKANTSSGSTNSSDRLTVSTDDEDKDGVLDDNDCNDDNVNVGECGGCAYCDDPLGARGTCIGGSCAAIICSGSCGYGICDPVFVPQFAQPTEPATCQVTGDTGVCAPTECQNYNCEELLDCYGDDDNDGVRNPADYCPNTALAHRPVNDHGCPMPTVTEFTPGLTSDFQTANLRNLTNMTLGITSLGEVKFIDNTTIVRYSTVDARYEPVDIDSNVDIQGESITVETDPPSGLTMVQGKPSILKLYELTIANPVLWIDAAMCPNCQILRPAEYSGGPGNPDTLIFWVPGFTTYSAQESACNDGFCYQGGGLEDCFSCSADCGVCPCDDDDGDGYGECPFCWTANTTCSFSGDDCNDDPLIGNPINPGATEIVYNGVDEDCDPSTRDYDIDDDGNNASGYGGSDCNDGVNTIGECNLFTGPSGCAVCSDPTGLSGTCDPDNLLCEPRDCSLDTFCGYGICAEGEIPVFVDPTEPGSCVEPACTDDTDLDGVKNYDDECPNTQQPDRPFVNAHGCPEPIATKFTPDLTTNFSASNLSNMVNMTLGITRMGQIKFIGNIMIMSHVATASSYYTRVNLDDNVNISYNLVSVDSQALPMLNTTGRVRLFNLTFTRPVMLRDGELCGSECSVIQYLGSTYKNLTFSVTHFTEYAATEHYCGDGRCDNDIGETCSCSDCPACPTVDDDNPSTGPSSTGTTDTCGRKPIQPCSVAVWVDWPRCEWDVSQCAGASENCTEGETRCSGDYLQRCEIRSPAKWHPIKMCSFGCNTSSVTCNAFMIMCREDWVCQQWTECTEGSQTRLCFDNNECNTFFDKPLEVKSCGPPLFPVLDSTMLTILIMTIIVVTSVLIAVLVLKLRNRRGVMDAATPFKVEEYPPAPQQTHGK
jgi:hypothetical protein